MKHYIFRTLTVFLTVVTALLCAATEGIQSDSTDKKIILNGTGMNPHAIEPTATFNESSRMLTIEFPAAGFVSYTLSVSSDDVTLNYTVTSPLYRVYVPTDVVEVDLQHETDGGDIFYGSFEATGGTMI